jgi:hypothetical protein
MLEAIDGVRVVLKRYDVLYKLLDRFITAYEASVRIERIKLTPQELSRLNELEVMGYEDD